MKHKISLQPGGIAGEVEAGKTIMQAARELGVDLLADCGGKGACGKCRVKVEAGGEDLSSITEEEKRILKDEIGSGYRLACCSVINGPLSITIPEQSLPSEPSILVWGETVPFALDPVIHKYHVDLTPLTQADELKSDQFLFKCMNETYRITDLSIDDAVLRQLEEILCQSAQDITVTVWEDKEVIDIQRGYVDDSFGIAIDIGTTTVVGYLVNLRTGEKMAVDAMVNPQSACGADVMIRIAYSLQNKGNRDELRKMITRCINNIISKVCKSAGVSTNDISEITIVGNTAMHHLFLGLDVTSLAGVPFEPVFYESCDQKAGQLDLEINPAANVHLLPIEGGFVGSDNVGVLISTQPHKYSGATLVIDIGTNGEIVIGGSELGLMSCSTAAGPAFEGAHIKFGMRAGQGAIEQVRIEPGTYDVFYHTIGEVHPIGLCGSGLIDAIAEMLRLGLIMPNGRMNSDLAGSRMIQEEDGPAFVIAWAKDTGMGKDIVITQKDIREVQLAKAAINAGITILLKHLGITTIQKVVLAGAFGSFINTESAMAIGLFPKVDLENIVAVGNAAGQGACMVLLSKSKREEAVSLARSVKYIELSNDPDFGRVFVKSTYFVI